MTGFDILFQQLLLKRLHAEIETEVMNIASGQVKSMEDYKDRTGYLRALRSVAAMCEEVAQDVAKR